MLIILLVNLILKRDFDVINLYLNSTYFNDKQKMKINELKMKLINRSNQIKNNKNNNSNFSVIYNNVSLNSLYSIFTNESINHII